MRRRPPLAERPSAKSRPSGGQGASRRDRRTPRPGSLRRPDGVLAASSRVRLRPGGFTNELSECLGPSDPFSPWVNVDTSSTRLTYDRDAPKQPAPKRPCQHLVPAHVAYYVSPPLEDASCLGSACLDDRGSIASAAVALKANGRDDLSVIIDADPQGGRDLAVFARRRRVSPKCALGSFG